MLITISATPLGPRPFLGLGVETDPWLYDETNAQAGVTPADHDLLDRRLRALQPALARLFTCVEWWNPDWVRDRYVWDQPDYRNLLRILRLLNEVGTSANLVLFRPQEVPPELAPHLRPLAFYQQLTDAMIALLVRLRDHEHLTCVRWLTLFNEPDAQFPHESPLLRRLFGDQAFARGRGWDDYVALNRYAQRALERAGLYPHVRLVVPDTVWGPACRAEKMQLAARDFSDLDVGYSYHNYSPEDPAFNNTAPADFQYPGMTAEARSFRRVLGEDKPLVIWEFNLSGPGFNYHFPGAGPRGTDLLGRVEAGPELVSKIMRGANHGIDGFCLWCFTDMVYLHWAYGPLMEFGLCRYRWQNWMPRPYFYYYAALVQAFRPGARIVGTAGATPPVEVLAAAASAGPVVAIANTGAEAQEVSLSLADVPGTGQLLRVRPAALPTADLLPVKDWQPTPPYQERLDLTLEGWELAIWRAGGQP